MKGRWRRGERAWMPRATSSLPVPLSPWMSTVGIHGGDLDHPLQHLLHHIGLAHDAGDLPEPLPLDEAAADQDHLLHVDRLGEALGEAELTAHLAVRRPRRSRAARSRARFPAGAPPRRGDVRARSRSPPVRTSSTGSPTTSPSVSPAVSSSTAKPALSNPPRRRTAGSRSSVVMTTVSLIPPAASRLGALPRLTASPSPRCRRAGAPLRPAHPAPGSRPRSASPASRLRAVTNPMPIPCPSDGLEYAAGDVSHRLALVPQLVAVAGKAALQQPEPDQPLAPPPRPSGEPAPRAPMKSPLSSFVTHARPPSSGVVSSSRSLP